MDLVKRSQREKAKGDPARIITRHLKANADASKGVRLIHYATLMNYINSQPEW